MNYTLPLSLHHIRIMTLPDPGRWYTPSDACQDPAQNAAIQWYKGTPPDIPEKQIKFSTESRLFKAMIFEIQTEIKPIIHDF